MSAIASARLVATVVLPVPPLPLATVRIIAGDHLVTVLLHGALVQYCR